MASWISLGIITPALNEWRSADVASIGGETFRITFLGLGPGENNRIWKTSALIDGIYFNGDSGSSVRLYPSGDREIIYLPIPPELKAAGVTVRYIRAKKLARYRLGRITEPAWGIEVEELIP